MTSAGQIRELIQKWYSERLGDDAEIARLYGVIFAENEAQMEYSYAIAKKEEQ